MLLLALVLRRERCKTRAMGRGDGDGLLLDGYWREVECGWKCGVICKTQAEKLPKITWIEAACQELREGSCQGEPVLAGWTGARADVRPRAQVGCTWAWARLRSKGTG